MDEALNRRLGEWDDAAWCLAAVALSHRSPTGNELLADAAREVLHATGAQPTDRNDPTSQQLAQQAAAPLHITSALLTGNRSSWSGSGTEALIAQGEASAQAAAMFAAYLAPQMADISERLGLNDACMLDVGTGVAALAVSFAERFQTLRVVGLDVSDTALRLAERTLAASPAADRITLRQEDVGDLTDIAAYDLVWLPAPFVPSPALEKGVARVAQALRPGGWVMIGHGKYGSGPLADAINRFKTIAFGGTPLTADGAQHLLLSNELVEVRTFPTPPGAPGITIGRSRPA